MSSRMAAKKLPIRIYSCACIATPVWPRRCISGAGAIARNSVNGADASAAIWTRAGSGTSCSTSGSNIVSTAGIASRRVPRKPKRSRCPRAMSFAKYWARLRRSWSGQPPEEHEQQLMQLYWNRAELKKELANQQAQRTSLSEKLRVQEAATRRANEQQDQLHVYLGNPEHGANALVYF